jgi:hypothetical protein
MSIKINANVPKKKLFLHFFFDNTFSYIYNFSIQNFSYISLLDHLIMTFTQIYLQFFD